MARFFKKSMSKTPGLPPGSLIHVGEKRTEEVAISVIDYDERELVEQVVDDIEDVFAFKDRPTNTWINIGGVHEIDTVEKIGRRFDIHPLTLEDIVNTHQRAKVEDYEHYLYIVARMLFFDEETDRVRSEQISLVLGKGFLLSFQEEEGDVFSGVRERIRKKRGRIRQSGCDYLAYALLDAIVDHYFVVLGAFGDRIEELEEELLDDPTQETSRRIHEMKREMIYLRRQIWPLREVLASLERNGSGLVEESTAVFLRDVYDHTIQVIESIEGNRDVLSGMLDNYLSVVSNRMNEVMKLLTLVATIFIPITFIAGIYGMNFKYMPELEWGWGYFLCLGLMATVVGAMLAYFRNKGWL